MPQQGYDDPIKNMIDGMLAGHQMASQIQHQKLQEEAMVRQAAREQREAGIQDIMAQMQLRNAGAMPVSNGMVEEFRADTPLAPNAAGLPGMVVPGGKFLRKAQNTVKIGDQAFELPSEEHQSALRITRAREGKTPIDINGAMSWVDPAQAPGLQKTMSEMQLVPTPDIFRQLGGPPMIPRSQAPQAMTAVTSILNRKATDQRAEDDRKSREGIADKNRTAADTRAENANTSRETIAGKRASKAASSASDIADRQARTQKAIADRQEARAIEKEDESKMHDERRRLGDILSSGKDLDAKGNEIDLNHKDNATLRGKLKTKYESVVDNLQGLQLRKAKLYGFNPPTKDQAAKIPEGQEVTGPDGRVWKKQDGVLYFVR